MLRYFGASTTATGCWSSTSGRDLRSRRCAGAAARAPPRRCTWARAVERAKRRATAAQGTPLWIWTTPGVLPGMQRRAVSAIRSTPNDGQLRPHERNIHAPRDRAARRPRRDGVRHGASGSSPTGSAATRRAPSPASLTRRYHGLLVAALPAPLGRMMMLNHLSSGCACADGSVVWLGDEDGGRRPNAARSHRAPRRVPARARACRCGVRASTASRIEKRVVMPHGQNTVHVTYRLLDGDGPGAARAAAGVALPRLRSAGQRVADSPSTYSLTATGDRYEISAGRGSARRCG